MEASRSFGRAIGSSNSRLKPAGGDILSRNAVTPLPHIPRGSHLYVYTSRSSPVGLNARIDPLLVHLRRNVASGTSDVGTFRTYGTGLMMSADWSKEDNPSLRRYIRV